MIPPGWTEAALGDVAALVRGVTFKPSDVQQMGDPGTVACMRTKNVQSELDLDDVLAVPASVVKRPDQYLLSGDTLVSSANSWNLVGKCSWVGELPWTSTFGGFVTALRAQRDKVDPRYLYRWFASPHTQAILRSFGRKTTSISNLSLDQTRRMTIPLPPIEEQRRIAAVLDQADELRAKRRAALALLDTLTESIFLDMFGDPAAHPLGTITIPLADFVERGDTLNYGVVQPGPDVRDGVPLVRAADLVGGTVRTSMLKRIAPEIDHQYRSSRIRGNEVLVSCVGSVGAIAIADSDLAGANIARAVARVPIADPDERTYVAAFMRLPIAQRFFQQELRTVAQPTLNLKQLRELKVLCPPAERVGEFAKRAREVAAITSDSLDHKSQADHLFASLQQRAFRGEL